MPCMPARRDMQTGRHTFLHRSWGPLEPFDNSFPEVLKTGGVYSHLISDCAFRDYPVSDSDNIRSLIPI